MRQKTSIEIFTYWNKIRGLHHAPLRAQMEPAAVRHVLSDLFILEALPSGALRFRLSGTRICGFFGRELRDEDFSALWAGSQPDDPVKIASGVMAHAAPALINATGYSIGGRSIGFELVLLPLRTTREDEGCDRLLGCLTPVANPIWLGSEPLEFLALDRSRLLLVDNKPAIATDRAPTGRAAANADARQVEWASAFRRILSRRTERTSPFQG
jgi:hypothetical protein